MDEEIEEFVASGVSGSEEYFMEQFIDTLSKTSFQQASYKGVSDSYMYSWEDHETKKSRMAQETTQELKTNDSVESSPLFVSQELNLGLVPEPLVCCPACWGQNKLVNSTGRRGAVIAAPSGSGKTYISLRNTGCVLDGDSFAIWPKGHRWWEDAKAVEVVSSVNSHRISACARITPFVFLFSEPSVADAVLLLNEDTHKKQLQIREDSGNTSQPGLKDWDRVSKHRDHLSYYAELLKIPIFNDWKRALDYCCLLIQMRKQQKHINCCVRCIERHVIHK